MGELHFHWFPTLDVQESNGTDGSLVVHSSAGVVTLVFQAGIHNGQQPSNGRSVRVVGNQRVVEVVPVELRDWTCSTA